MPPTQIAFSWLIGAAALAVWGAVVVTLIFMWQMVADRVLARLPSLDDLGELLKKVGGWGLALLAGFGFPFLLGSLILEKLHHG